MTHFMKVFIYLMLSFLLLPLNGKTGSIEPYSAPFWLPGGNLQTIYAAKFVSTPQVSYRRERWELPDGDFVDVDWIDAETIENLPVVVLFHGLEGNSQSSYARALMSEVKSKGWRGVVIHFRGCSGEPNRLPRVYYAGDTAEIQQFLSRVRSEVKDVPIYAVGVSLGGNALLKWLGETSDTAKLIVNKAVAVSAPIDLAASAQALDTGLNRLLYTRLFVSSMKPKALEMLTRFPDLLDKEKIMTAKSIHDIDNVVTAQLYGARDAEDYYQKNASKPWLKYISLPTLILNAKNDPFLPANKLPNSDEVSNFVTLDFPESGGHVGFAGKDHWLPKKILHFFESP